MRERDFSERGPPALPDYRQRVAGGWVRMRGAVWQGASASNKREYRLDCSGHRSRHACHGLRSLHQAFGR
jgi:hypothetical protein